MAETALERVADYAAVGARTRRVHPEFRLLCLQEVVQLTLRHARLERHVGQRLAEVDDAIQPAQVQQHGVLRGCLGSVSPVLTGTDRVERDGESIRNAHALLDLVAGSGPKDGQHRR